MAELFLRRCSVGAPGCTALALSMRVNTVLRELDLAWNAIAHAGSAPH